jgi:hypothetical protein
MSVRRMSAHHLQIFNESERAFDVLSLFFKPFSLGLSSPKAKVTRSNRVGCAIPKLMKA